MTNKKGLLLLLLVLPASLLHGQAWQLASDHLLTSWGEAVTPENAWTEYPRPQLQRAAWMNLNGLWDYALVERGTDPGDEFQGEILVPFALEASLSGVGKTVTEAQEVWYRRTFEVPEAWAQQRLLLHFGAVDWQATVYLNGEWVGEHKGGSDPFSFEVTDQLQRKGPQELRVKVWDPTDAGLQPRGKQTLNPEGIWYTAVSGIWQTVWMEPVARGAVKRLLPVADIDREEVTLQVALTDPKGNEQMEVKVSFEGEVVHESTQAFTPELTLSLPDAELWSPAFPHLYDVEVKVWRKGKVIDEVASYFAMRKISLQQDENGIQHLALNNQPLFHWGTLDQGWWPDGLLTPPSDEAMKYDLEVLKKMGFNMVRKHIKVEPARYYYHADTLGMLLWQDMPSGFAGLHDKETHVEWGDAADWVRPEASARQFEAEWKAIMDATRFFPSIVVWVPFNEGWGQYETKRIVEWTMEHDPTRLVNATSGWTDRGVGHMYDAHQYPGPGMEPPQQHPGRAMVLGEFGGLGLPVSGHLWDESKNNWGYRTYQTQSEFLNAYALAISGLQAERARGLAAAIYTQTTDVELEANGLMTYDRAVIKLPLQLAQVLHSPLYARYGPPVWLVPDSEVAPHAKVFHGEGQAPEKLEGPYPAKKGQQLHATQTFTLEKVPDHLAIKLYAWGDVRVFLNGQLVLEKFIRTDRHFDDLNLSAHRQGLREGENTLRVELEAGGDNGFDYGLYGF